MPTEAQRLRDKAFEKTDRNAEVCRLRFENALTLEEIGERFGITRERVRQITKRDGRFETFHRTNPFYETVASAKKANSLLSVSDLSRMFKISRQTVCVCLKSAGVSASVPVGERFWKRVAVGGPDDCWPWLGAINKKTGYGSVRLLGHGSTHRLAFKLSNGSIPDGLWVLHKCDNPPCCNPKHLFAGTPLDNVQDSIAKGRRSNKTRARGERSGKAKLTEVQALEIKRALIAGVKPKDLAGVYPISLAGVYSIKAGHAWAWLTA